MILQDDGIAITAEKIATIVKAAIVAVEFYWPSRFAKLALKMNIEDLNAPVVEEKKEEPKEESDDDM